MTKARTLADNYAADINQVTADAPLTGGGTSGTVTVGIQAGTTAQSGAVQLTDSTASTSTTTAATPNSVKSAYDLANGAIAKSTIDAKGDLLVGSADDTVSRLAVASTAGYVLTVDSAEATGLKWAAASSGSTFAGCAVRKNASQSITTNVITAITWPVEDIDTDGFHSTSTNTSRFTVPTGKAGKYQIGWWFSDIGGGGVAGALITTYIYKNGTNITGYRDLQVKGDIDYMVSSGSVIVDAAVGDYFEIFYKNYDESANIYADNSTAYFYYLGA